MGVLRECIIISSSQRTIRAYTYVVRHRISRTLQLHTACYLSTEKHGFHAYL